MQRIFVSKSELAKHPRFEQFRKTVYEKNATAQTHDVLDETDTYQIAVFTPSTQYLDAIIDRSYCSDEREVSVEGFINAVTPGFIKPKRIKRKKGSRRKEPTVNKATILFMSGEAYTVKDFVSIEATAESVVFVMEDNWKGTVNYRQAITVPNDDVAEVKVRGVKHQFVLDMGLTNMGQVVFQADGVEMFASSISLTV